LVNLAQTDPEKRNIELFDEGQAEIIKAHGLELAQEPDATTTEPQSNPTARSARNWGGAGSGRDLGLELIFDFAIGFLLALGLVMGLLLAISNAAGAQALANQPPTHPELQKLLELKPEKTPPATIQLDALAQVASEVALDLGAKTRYAEILEKLEPVAEALDETFDFEPLVVKKGQLYLEPPVVATLTEEVALIAPSEARGQGLTYRMTRTGRFLSRPPHWRDYLFAPYKLKLPEPEQIHPTLRPTNAQERAIWEKHARLGWRKGVDQAERLFAEALTALTRDYLGALRFWDLANQGLVQGPTIEMVKTPFQSQPGEIVWNATQYKISSPGQFRRDNPPSATIPNSPKKPRRRS
jgi:defect-in-organelle-trafficking protein DotC